MVRGAKPEHRLVSIFSSAESSSDHTVFDRGIPFRTHCCFFLIRNARGMAKIYKHPTKRNYHTSTTTTKPNDITIRERGERSGSSSNSVQTVSVFRRRRSPTFEGSNRAGGTRRPMGCCEGDGVFGSTPLPIRKGKGGGGGSVIWSRHRRGGSAARADTGVVCPSSITSPRVSAPVANPPLRIIILFDFSAIPSPQSHVTITWGPLFTR